MSQLEIQKYCDLMKEIKRRTSVIDFFLWGSGHALYQAATIESICLQLRKILESIAMGLLVANKDEYSEVCANFATHWNAEYLIGDVERVNPNFYPEPITEEPSSREEVKSDWKKRKSDYLTKEDFIKVYKKCGAIMHAGNPYGSRVDYSWYEKSLPRWRQQVINLLSSHTIRLVNDSNLYLIHLEEDRDERVHYYVFTPAHK